MGSLVNSVTRTVEQRTQCTDAIASSKETGSNKSIAMPDPQLPLRIPPLSHRPKEVCAHRPSGSVDINRLSIFNNHPDLR